MPNPGSDAPLRKVTLNLYEADVVEAQRRYGRGWSERLREVWQRHMQETHAYEKYKATEQ